MGYASGAGYGALHTLYIYYMSSFVINFDADVTINLWSTFVMIWFYCFFL